MGKNSRAASASAHVRIIPNTMFHELLQKGVPREELDWWLFEGPLSWDHPFPPTNDLKVGVDWHNTLQKGTDSAADNLEVKEELNYKSLGKGYHTGASFSEWFNGFQWQRSFGWYCCHCT